MKVALAIRHIAFEDLGNLGPVLSARGYRVHYVEAGIADFSVISPLDADLLICLGGPISANDEDQFPFVADEMALLRTRVDRDLPTLGICLGAQMIARAFGAKVIAAARKELGWCPLELTEAGSRSVLRYLDGPVLHWHAENCELPVGAISLARTEHCPHQAFRMGKRSLALQFHPEVTTRNLERWFIGHVGEITSTSGLSLSQLRKDTQCHGPALEEISSHFWNAWLDQVE